MKLKERTHEWLHRVGIDVVPYSGRYFGARRRIETLRAFAVDLVADVGANEGQWARQVRHEGYPGEIVSFEPLREAFERLDARCGRRWSAHRVALGPEEGRATFYRAGNSWSSSLLPITERHLSASPDAGFEGTEQVEVRTLDSFGLRGRVYLKIDAQGYELPILAGAERTLLDSTVGLELELSTTPLYEGQALVGETLEAVRDRGFVPLWLGPSFVDPRTGEILQLDGIFARETALRPGSRSGR